MRPKTKSTKRTKFKTAAEAAAHLADDPRVANRVRALTQAHTRRAKLAKAITDMLFERDSLAEVEIKTRIEQLLKKWKV